MKKNPEQSTVLQGEVTGPSFAKPMEGRQGYTPGPWRDEGGIIVAASGDEVAEIVAHNSTVPSPQMRANRKLIAAAPDLLAELENCLHLLEALELQPLPRYFKAQIDATNGHARKAIAKAKWGAA